MSNNNLLKGEKMDETKTMKELEMNAEIEDVSIMESVENVMEEEKKENEEVKVGYKDVLKQKEYVKLIIANLISRFGDSIDAIAFTWLVYAITGSAAWSAIIFAVNQLPSVLVQPFAGALVENMDKKKIILTIN